MYFEVTQNDNSPIICNVPHASIKVPGELEDDYVFSYDELRRESLAMADLYTDELYEDLIRVSSCIRSTISRIVVDIERFANEKEEPMSKMGMSAFYTRTSEGDDLRKVSKESRAVLQKMYDDYHEMFRGMVASSLVAHNRALIVDCHSFPSVPRKYESDQEANRPDICIGVDTYHTPQKLVDLLRTNFEKDGYSVKINSPFAGTIVPVAFYRSDQRVVSVMIEVNRALYMNEETYQKLKTFSRTSKRISRCVLESLNEFYYSS